MKTVPESFVDDQQDALDLVKAEREAYAPPPRRRALTPQQRAIFHALFNHPRGLTTWELINHCQIIDIGKRVSEMRARGVGIVCEKAGVSRWGSAYYRYRLTPNTNKET